MSNATNAATPRAADRQSRRDALAPYVEGVTTGEDSSSLSTYEWLDTNGHTIHASTIDLGIEL